MTRLGQSRVSKKIWWIITKNNLRRITLLRGPIWGIHSLSLIISWFWRNFREICTYYSKNWKIKTFQITGSVFMTWNCWNNISVKEMVGKYGYKEGWKPLPWDSVYLFAQGNLVFIGETKSIRLEKVRNLIWKHIYLAAMNCYWHHQEP